jgi:hypothetical protein
MNLAGIVAVIAPDQTTTLLVAIAVCVLVVVAYGVYSVRKKGR